MKMLAVIFLLFAGCAGSSSNHDSDGAVGVKEWDTVQFADLKDTPTVTAGYADGSTYIKVETASQKLFYRVDHQTRTIDTVAPFEGAGARTLTTSTYARDVQRRAMFDQYEDVWRCRSSENWRAVASRDLRKEGPLLFRAPFLNHGHDSFLVLLAIDSSTLAVTGLSGMRAPDHFDVSSESFTSNPEGPNHLFGPTSRATMTNSMFSVFCIDAYRSSLPAYKQLSDSEELHALNNDRDHEISSWADAAAQIRKVDLTVPENRSYLSEPFNEEAVSNRRPKITLDAVEKLINTAENGSGVGL